MKIIEVDNVNQAVARAIPYLLSEGIRENSRNGSVLVAPGPVITIYNKPKERVLFSATRDANPFFHLMESLWMLAGRNDLGFPLYFNSRFNGYSDDGVHIHGAYGHRWRYYFGYDQLVEIVKELDRNPTSRRAVLTMWSPVGDLKPIQVGEPINNVWAGGMSGKDVPCNTHAYFDVRYDKLNMTVCNRSNDIIWGAYGANVVHFSMLQEYLAAWLDVDVGVYRQFSNNFHVYLDTYDVDKLQTIAAEAYSSNYYDNSGLFKDVKPVATYPITANNIDDWNQDLITFFAGRPNEVLRYIDEFFVDVVEPMNAAWGARKTGGNPLIHIEKIKAEDWQLACLQWLSRRERKKH